MRNKNKFGVAFNTMPGFPALGQFFLREDVKRMESKEESVRFAKYHADFGAPFTNQFSACVVRHIAGKGWKAVEEFHCEVW